jgi:UDPglucose 6-dehydrogenase
VRKGIGSDSRIGYPFLFPGTGYGGSCFPKDVKALLRTGAEPASSSTCGRGRAHQRAQKKLLVEKVDRSTSATTSRGKTIAMWGLAFKPKTDDMREAPSHRDHRGAAGKGAKVQAFDPVAMDTAKRASSATASPTARSSTTHSKAPTRCSSSPSGTSSATSTSTA